MERTSTRSLLDALIGGVTTPRGATRVCDLMLMAACADGELSQAALDRVGRAVLDVEALQGVDWDEVMHRAEAVRDDAPLFFETRALVAHELTDPGLRRAALSLAARIAAPTGELGDEARALLEQVAESFALTEADRDAVFEEALAAPAPDDALPFRRTAFNNPTLDADRSLFDALQESEVDGDLPLLLFKLEAVRTALSELFEKAEVVSVGERVQFGPHLYRVDAIVQDDAGRVLMRFLGPREALHPEEHPIIRDLLDRLPATARFMVGHAGPLAPADDSFLQGLDPTRLRVERLER